MSLNTIMTLPRLSLCTATVLLALSSLNAQSVTTAPVGAVTFTAKANSDSLIAVPMARPVSFSSKVSSVSGTQIVLASDSLTSAQFQYVAGTQPNTYYIQLTSGAKAGQLSTIVANSANSITTEFEADILAGIQSGDSFEVRPYWTLGTLFPAASANTSFVASTSNLASGRRTEILIPDFTNVGINKAASAIYFYNSYWRKSGDTTPNRNDVILPPDGFITIRGNNYSTDTTLTVVGAVPPLVQTTSLLASTTQNDNPVGLSVPVDRTLSQLGLNSSAFVPSTSNLASGRGDELLVFDNAQAVKNKAASAIYFYNGFWRKSGATSADQGSTVIPAGSAIVIRKKAQASASVVDWNLAYTY